MYKRKQIKIRESEIPFVEIQVLTNNFQPIGTYSLPNFSQKYRSR
jgi:hypothetical protein